VTDAFHERTLLRSLDDGDDAAFWALWEQYQRHLYAVCLRQMNGAHFDAADAVSRAMLVAQSKLPSYAAHIENLEAWLTRLTCNICLDMHRERHRATQGRVNLDESIAVEDPALSCAQSPEDDYLACEVRKIVSSAINDLPAALRDAAHLRFVQETPYPVMARTLSITVENARKRVQQARAILRQRIKADLYQA
jgi:RNA polymerase sigma factor (sigma-70 family)